MQINVSMLRKYRGDVLNIYCPSCDVYTKLRVTGKVNWELLMEGAGKRKGKIIKWDRVTRMK